MVVNRHGRESLQVIVGFKQVHLTPCLVRWIAKCKALTQKAVTQTCLMVRVVMFVLSSGSQRCEWQGTRYPMSPRRRARVSRQDKNRSVREMYASRRGEARLELYIELTGTLRTLEVALCRAMWCALQLGIQRPHYIVQRIGRGSSSAYARFLFCDEKVRHALLDEYRLEEKQWVGRERWKFVRIERVLRGARKHPAANSLHIYIYIYIYIYISSIVWKMFGKVL